MVCYMYYTDVFVGTDNIENLKNALEAELKGFKNNSIDLTQLVQGLCLFMGYPSCLCKPKKSVEESLEKISGELNEELENYECLKPNSDLNCSSCKSLVVCKCCVLDCILKVQGSSCQCVKGNNNNCSCSDVEPKRCCKDLLEKLKASLSLLNLKADMETLCTCDTKNCCESGTCTSGCTLCSPSKFPDNAMTGLGICPMNPKKLAQKLEGYFKPKTGGSQDCSCQCNGKTPSCCCLACPENSSNKKCLKSCTAKCGSQGCSCAQPQTSQCPCKTFCLAINDFKIASNSGDMKCCDGGKKCHCEIDGSGSGTKCTASSTSGSFKCCIETVTGSNGSTNYKHSVKCLLRRLVLYFKSLEPLSSSPDIKNFKNCCELMCVIKTCEFLWKFYGKRNATVCSKCKKGAQGGCSGSSGKCCKGTISDCTDQNCCKDCENCNAVKFSRALEELRFAGPCGQDLYRVLKDFLECCGRLRGSLQYVENKLKGLTCCQVQSNGQSCTCCSSVSGTSSSSGNCKGCTALLQDPKLKALLFSQYSSSYSSASASWPDCSSSKSGSCCSNPSCNSCTSGSCPPQGCCEKCPKRLCAKIFLGFLPALYFGLKIVYERCDSKNSAQWPGWQKISVSYGKPSSDLAKFFKAWGFDSSTLNTSLEASKISSLLSSLFPSGSPGILEKLYDASMEYFSKKYSDPTSGSHSSILSHSKSKDPLTVRDILLWLYGLRFTSGFPSLVSHSEFLCSPFGNSFHPDAFCYYLHVSCFLLPVSVISFIEDSSSAQKVFSSSSSPEWKSFSYPEDPFKLFETFCDFVRKIYIPLTFIRFQCERGRDQAGWQECFFGQNCSVSSSSVSSPSPSGCSCPNSKTYLCTAINKDKVHDHCNGNGGSQNSCLGFGSGSTCDISKNHPQSPAKATSSTPKCTPCPHPLLNFLTDGSESQPKASPSLFKPPPGFPPMGFSKENLPSPGRNGHVLHDVLIWFCTNGFYPLTRLTEFALCIFRNPPDTLGELFGFFRRFRFSDVFTSKFADYVSGEPGFYSGSDLKKALENLFGSHSGSHSDLKSLYDCSTSTCGKYLYPLTYNAYNNNIFIDDFMDTYLSWVCYSAEDFKKKLKEFQGEFESCCSKSSCQNIVDCPCILPKFYKYGFTFMLPSKLSGKKCSDFITQLKAFVTKSTLDDLIAEIEKFLWSI
ncbi:variant erythrocyte surface antigen-1 family protein, partial [Babesia divergens]